MIGLTVWCLMIVTSTCDDTKCQIETAVKGKVVNEIRENLLVDFSEYATKQGYIGNFKEPKLVLTETCVKE